MRSLLTLGATGLVSGDPELVRAAYLAMDLLVTAVLLPLALAALATGVLLGLGTRWGLARHWWVLAKLALTIVGASAAVVLLRPSVNQAAATALAVAAGGAANRRHRPGRGQGAAGADTRGPAADHGRGACGLQALGQTRFRQYSGPDRELHGPLACRRYWQRARA